MSLPLNSGSQFFPPLTSLGTTRTTTTTTTNVSSSSLSVVPGSLEGICEKILQSEKAFILGLDQTIFRLEFMISRIGLIRQHSDNLEHSISLVKDVLASANAVSALFAEAYTLKDEEQTTKLVEIYNSAKFKEYFNLVSQFRKNNYICLNQINEDFEKELDNEQIEDRNKYNALKYAGTLLSSAEVPNNHDLFEQVAAHQHLNFIEELLPKYQGGVSVKVLEELCKDVKIAEQGLTRIGYACREIQTTEEAFFKNLSMINHRIDAAIVSGSKFVSPECVESLKKSKELILKLRKSSLSFSNLIAGLSKYPENYKKIDDLVRIYQGSEYKNYISDLKACCLDYHNLLRNFEIIEKCIKSDPKLFTLYQFSCQSNWDPTLGRFLATENICITPIQRLPRHKDLLGAILAGVSREMQGKEKEIERLIGWIDKKAVDFNQNLAVSEVIDSLKNDERLKLSKFLEIANKLHEIEKIRKIDANQLNQFVAGIEGKIDGSAVLQLRYYYAFLQGVVKESVESMFKTNKDSNEKNDHDLKLSSKDTLEGIYWEKMNRLMPRIMPSKLDPSFSFADKINIIVNFLGNGHKGFKLSHGQNGVSNGVMKGGELRELIHKLVIEFTQRDKELLPLLQNALEKTGYTLTMLEDGKKGSLSRSFSSIGTSHRNLEIDLDQNEASNNNQALVVFLNIILNAMVSRIINMHNSEDLESINAQLFRLNAIGGNIKAEMIFEAAKQKIKTMDKSDLMVPGAISSFLVNFNNNNLTKHRMTEIVDLMKRKMEPNSFEMYRELESFNSTTGSRNRVSSELNEPLDENGTVPAAVNRIKYLMNKINPDINITINDHDSPDTILRILIGQFAKISPGLAADLSVSLHDYKPNFIGDNVPESEFVFVNVSDSVDDKGHEGEVKFCLFALKALETTLFTFVEKKQKELERENSKVTLTRSVFEGNGKDKDKK